AHRPERTLMSAPTSPEESQEVTALRHSASTWPEDLPRTVHLPKSEQIDTGDSDEEITEKLRRQGSRIGRGTIAPAVFWPSMIVIVLVAVLSIAFPESAATAMEGSQNWIVANLGWFYMLAIGLFVAFAIVVALSSWGSIRLGRDDDEPEFGLLSWFAMLFSAGMGVGLVFYGVAEPLGYTTGAAKPGWTGEGVELSGVAMAQTFLHWGLHPWAACAVVGLARASAIHRRGPPVRGWARRPAAAWAPSSTSSLSPGPCSAPPPRWAWAPSRSAPACRSSGAWTRPPRTSWWCSSWSSPSSPPSR